MQILGLSSFKHDAAAALLEEGVVRSAIENDKVTRSQTRGVPEAAIQCCFETIGSGWCNIDLVALAARPLQGWARKSFLRAKLSAMAPVTSASYAAKEVGLLARDLNHIAELRREAPGSRVACFEHHLCHAASAFFPSPFDRALIVTMDEDGDGCSTMLAMGEGSRIRPLRTIAFPHSLGWVYSQVTELIGFKPHLQEHKTQWLSLEGEPRFKDVFLKMLRSRDGCLPHLDYRFFNRGLAGPLSFSEKFYRSTSLPSARAAVRGRAQGSGQQHPDSLHGTGDQPGRGPLSSPWNSADLLCRGPVPERPAGRVAGESAGSKPGIRSPRTG